MCGYCDEHEAMDGIGCCPACLVDYRIEVAWGFAQLADYLAHWAAFQDWCSAHERVPAAA